MFNKMHIFLLLTTSISARPTVKRKIILKKKVFYLGQLLQYLAKFDLTNYYLIDE